MNGYEEILKREREDQMRLDQSMEYLHRKDRREMVGIKLWAILFFLVTCGAIAMIIITLLPE